MAQGEFTKEEAKRVQQIVEEVFEAISQKRRGHYFGHLNDIFLFLEAAEKAAPESIDRVSDL
jgi:hypothetical protein